jgi:hypothetical protein
MLTAKEISLLINKYKSLPGNSCGGNCHIVLDDLNINDDDIHYCMEHCNKNNDVYGAFLMRQMLLMRKTARKKAIMMGLDGDCHED